MTKEELKEHCKKQIEMCEMWAKAKGKNPCGKVYEEHKMILELLEQTPCEDAVSRQALKRKLQEHHDFFIHAYNGFSNMPQNDKSRVDEITNCIAMVVNEPSVTPKEKSEYEHDHEAVKAYNDGQAYILDKIRAEIENDWQFKNFPRSPWSCGLRRALEIIDKYRGDTGA